MSECLPLAHPESTVPVDSSAHGQLLLATGKVSAPEMAHVVQYREQVEGFRINMALAPWKVGKTGFQVLLYGQQGKDMATLGCIGGALPIPRGQRINRFPPAFLLVDERENIRQYIGYLWGDYVVAEGGVLILALQKGIKSYKFPRF